MSRIIRRAALGIALAIVATVALASWRGADVAEAHAILVRSDPASGAELPGTPEVIELWFSEPLEPAASSFELLDSDGNAIPVGGIAVDPADPYHLTGRVDALRPGFYTVVYLTVSTADGHAWSGAFSFAVLNPDGSRPSGAAAEVEGLGAGASTASVAGRWLSYAGLSLLLGGVALYRPLFARRDEAPALWRSYLAVNTRLGVAGVALAGAGVIVVGMEQRDALPGVSFAEFVGSTRAGAIWASRALAVEAAAVLAGLAVMAGRQQRRRGQAVVIALLPVPALVALGAATWQSHANAAPGDGWAMLAHATHAVASAAWVGGLVVLLVLLVVAFRGRPATQAEARAVLVPFSTFALGAVFVLTATGIVRALGELPSSSALWGSDYGRWLLLKVALFGGALLAAVRNRWRIEALAEERAAGESGWRAVQALRRWLPAEAALVLAALGVVAVLAQTPTPRGDAAVSAAQVAQPFSGVLAAEGLNAHVQLTPGSIGPNEVTVHLYADDPEEDVAAEIRRVLVEARRADAAGGERVAAEFTDPFFAAEVVMGQSLTWTLHVEVIRDGHDDAAFDFEVPIPEATASNVGTAPFSSPAPQLPRAHLLAILAILGGVGVTLVAGRLPRPAPLYATGGLLAVAGILTLSYVDPADAVPENPYPADPASIARGQALYVESCEVCHGVGGRGDGPAAADLDPRPADLRIHVPAHPDHGTYGFIALGVPGTAMPAWGDQLEDGQIWDLVNYLIDEYGGE